jgi:hypothetical protein
MLERLGPSAEETVTQWVRAFGVALTGGNDKALTELFLPIATGGICSGFPGSWPHQRQRDTLR